MARDDTRDERHERRSRSTRLDVPRETHRPIVTVPRPSYDAEAFGRVSERIARFLGTGTFIIWMTVVIIVWVLWNVFGPTDLRWDDYPFIFLTLMLSLQASYAAPLILLATNRQESRDRVNLEQDRETNARAHADMEYLAREVASLRLAVGEVATRDYIRSELRSLLNELEERAPRTDEAAESDPSHPHDRPASTP